MRLTLSGKSLDPLYGVIKLSELGAYIINMLTHWAWDLWLHVAHMWPGVSSQLAACCHFSKLE